MPRRRDIKKILVIGSGPIQIGQACEFDYSGTQALKALKDQGFETVLVNSNPATIMTDPEMSDRTYIEALVPEVLEQVIVRERPDAILPTLGGQVALNLTMELHRLGVLDTYGVEVLGAKIDSIQLAEDREEFRNLLLKLNLPVLKSEVVKNFAEGIQAAEKIGFPMILRPSFTLGGSGGGVVFNREELPEKLREALRASPVSEVLLEESISGWKELEYEIMCDRKSQMVVVCTIENMDPMGVHTGDSITVAPIQTLTDKEHQRLREACKKIAEGVGIQTGGCNIQFALDPHSDRWVVVEMNPRVSRSSALASKATGFPIAKIAALLAVGYSLDEISNDITRETPASFEPALDYVVVKVPRFNFEKFQQSEPILGTQMKSVGEVMAIGRSFQEALQKAFNSLEIDGQGFELPSSWRSKEVSIDLLRSARFDRWFLIMELLRRDPELVSQIQEITQVDFWFLNQLKELAQSERECANLKISQVDEAKLRELKCLGFSDQRLADLLGCTREQVEKRRLKLGVRPQINLVDTCAGEFKALTPYYYFAYEEFPAEFSFSLNQTKLPKDLEAPAEIVIVLGSGPNRIGQGVEFDYCCVKAVQNLRAAGKQVVMVNCNPETVSTDYDISDRLYFEPLEYEYVQEIIDLENQKGKVIGVVCQTGGQTALKLSQELKSVRLLGTEAKQIDRAEDRSKFDRLLQSLKMKRPKGRTAKSISDLERTCQSIGYPVLVRPSYVLGGRAMHIVGNREQLEPVLKELKESPKKYWPVLVDQFLDHALELDIDCVGDGGSFEVAAIMEHIEEAGIHSGDSSCVLPPISLNKSTLKKIEEMSLRICKELQVAGFLNIQMAIYKDEIYLLEVNPRASRTLPFVCKATGIDWVGRGIEGMLKYSGFADKKLKMKKLALFQKRKFPYYSVKQVVFPFLKFPGVDVLLGPEMKSTGEVMSAATSFEEAFLKGLLASYHRLPKTGTAFVSVKDSDKTKIVELCRELKRLGFRIVATHGTAAFLRKHSIVCSGINKVKEGQPHIVDAIINSQIDLLINTTDGVSAISDSYSIRRSALQTGIPYFTTLTAARAAVSSLEIWIRGDFEVFALQDLHGMYSSPGIEASHGGDFSGVDEEFQTKKTLKSGLALRA